MTIEFACHSCGSTLRVDEVHLGKQARCPNCSTVQLVQRQDSNEAEQKPASLSGTGDPGQNDPYEQTDPHQQIGSDVDGRIGSSAATSANAAGDSANGWRVRTPDGQVFGPASQTEVEKWVQEGRINEQCLVQKPGEQIWQSATIAIDRFQQLSPKNLDFSTVAAGSGGGQYSYAGTPHTPQHNPYQNYRSHKGALLLVFGILGVMLCPIFSIVAWIMGHGELAAIKRGEVDPGGKGLALAGYVLGIVGTIILLLQLLFFVGMFSLMIISEM